MKRFLSAVAAVALLFILAACGRGVLASSEAVAPNATPTSSTSRNVRSEPVSVTETYAKADTVPGGTAQALATGTDAQPTDAAQPGETVQAETPATGDFPIVYFAGVLGLILVCSAGLLMLRRI